MKLGRAVAVWVLLLAVLAPAGAAAAETRTFLNTQRFGPSGGAGNVGPASSYPGLVSVSGLNGTVTKVTLTVIELFATDDLDMALVGPNGAQVMLMSDACSSLEARGEIWTFEDAALFPVSEKGCPFATTESFKPTNFGNPADDNFGPGGPVGPFASSLSVFNGISPNGDWKLFMIDDDEEAVGFEMPAFTLNLEIEPAPPAVQTVTVPGPERIVKVPAKTGKRAAALAKCKKKPTPEKKAKCRAAAKKLPV
jgi:hypothetical protein